jgi:hypothetical protein
MRNFLFITILITLGPVLGESDAFLRKSANRPEDCYPWTCHPCTIFQSHGDPVLKRSMLAQMLWLLLQSALLPAQKALERPLEMTLRMGCPDDSMAACWAM